MGILYIITLIILGISFMIFKKSDEKLNFIKWLIIYIVSLYGYNIVIGMILGLLNITSYIWLLSLINLIFSIILGYKAIKTKEYQKYFVRKQDIAGIIFAFIIFGVMFVKDLYIYKGDITHFAIDSAIHYRAAKHYSDYLKIFINVEDKSFFDFNVMQTGAYINDGIFMNIMHGITNIDYAYLYQAFETITLFLSGLAFYAIFMEKIETKRGFLLSFILFALYMYGYPYNSWIYGFSYLSVGIMLVAMLVPVVEALYQKVNKSFIIAMIGILATGLIFSYCLFVPAIFAAICIYVFLKDFKEEGKVYLKFFKKNTIIVTTMLLVIALAGAGYLFIPTFFIEGQTNLVVALKADGAIYSEKYANFVAYIPFALLYCVEIVRKIMKRELTYFDVFAICMMGFLALTYLGMLFGKISPYYMLKIYFIIWMVVIGVTIDLVNKYIDQKVAKWIMPIYISVWAIFVCSWVWIKAGHVIGEEEKHALKNYVGMYYIENCEYRKLIDFTQNFKKKQLELAIFSRENLDGMCVDNTELITNSYYQRTWLTAVTEITSENYTYPQVIQDVRIHTLDEALEDERKQYVIAIADLPEVKEELNKYRDDENIEILMENDAGYVLKINR